MPWTPATLSPTLTPTTPTRSTSCPRGRRRRGRWWRPARWRWCRSSSWRCCWTRRGAGTARSRESAPLQSQQDLTNTSHTNPDFWTRCSGGLITHFNPFHLLQISESMAWKRSPTLFVPWLEKLVSILLFEMYPSFGR